MRTTLALIALLLLDCTSNAQSVKKYFIAFKDKTGSIYSTANPQQYLTQRAINRRAKYSIAITTQDLPVNDSYVQQVKSVGVAIAGQSKWLNGVIVSTNDPSKITTITQLPFVVSSTDVLRKSNVASDKFADATQYTQRSSQLYDSTYYGADAPAIRQLNLSPLHNQGYTGANTLIAVLDAGFPNVNTLAAFDSINQQSKIIYTYDVVLNQPNVYSYNGHGTAVLSCITGNIPNSFVGTGFGATFALLRTEDAPTENIVEEYYWVIGAEKADSIGADIITSSLGYTAFDTPTQNHTYANMNGSTAVCSKTATIATHKGIVVCVAAGNEGQNPWQYISAPADADSICTVGAVTTQGIRAGFSSVGPTADGRTKPTVMANGAGKALVDEFGNITNANGTSFACPTLAGAMACLFQKHPTLTPMQLIEAVQLSATLAQSPNNQYGWGIPNFGLASFLLSDTNNKTIIENKIYGSIATENTLVLYFIKSKDAQLTITLLDMNGKIMLQKNSVINTQYDEITFPITTAIPSGAYLVRISGNNSTTTLRVIK